MTALLLAATFAMQPAMPAADVLKPYFGFFIKGDGPAPASEAESKKMLEGHLANLTKVMLEHNGLAAGPLNDPTKERRGIIAFQAKSEAEGSKYFEADPFVKAKIMSVVLMEWKVDPAKFTIKKADPTALTEYQLFILKPGMSLQPLREGDMKAHADYLNGLYKTIAMRAHGEIKGPTKMREVGIFEGKDAKPLEDALKNDPLVKRQLLEYEILPLWMSKGIFGS